MEQKKGEKKRGYQQEGKEKTGSSRTSSQKKMEMLYILEKQVYGKEFHKTGLVGQKGSLEIFIGRIFKQNFGNRTLWNREESS